jgi:hypothetical protein
LASILLARGGYSPGREDVRHAEKNMDQASLSSDIGFTLRIRDREARLIRKIRPQKGWKMEFSASVRNVAKRFLLKGAWLGQGPPCVWNARQWRKLRRERRRQIFMYRIIENLEIKPRGWPVWRRKRKEQPG